jgi:hypothetical protein
MYRFITRQRLDKQVPAETLLVNKPLLGNTYNSRRPLLGSERAFREIRTEAI